MKTRSTFPHLPTTRLTITEVNAGYTLIELCLAIMICALLASSVTSRFLDAPASTPILAAESLRTHLAMTRAAAIASGRVARVAFSSTSASSCWTSICPASGGGESPVLQTNGSALHWSTDAAHELHAPSWIDFGPDGTPSSSSVLTVAGIELHIDPITGLVTRRPVGAP